MNFVIQVAYFAAALLFILGLRQMSSPATARRGILWAGVGMLAAVLVTFFAPDVRGVGNYLLMFLGIGLGGGLAWWFGRRVAMTDMPQMIALYNGMGGGAAAAIAAVELVRGAPMSSATQVLAAVGALIGAVAFAGSLVAFAKLQRLLKSSLRFPRQRETNLAVLAFAALLGLLVAFTSGGHSGGMLFLFLAAAFVFGVLMALPIGGADMPVVISLFNALTGLAVGLEGFVLGNPAMMIAGIVVGAAGTLLTQLMAKAMNRPLGNVLFAQFGGDDATVAAEGGPGGHLKPIEGSDAGVLLAYANKLIVVPGYGMAVAQAQHKLWELCELLIERGVTVKFAIHPVAGRMPGHMNVLLAEAGVPYDLIHDLDEINGEFATADAALVIGANDVVNPAARSNPDSPIYGMPILNVDKAKHVIVIKRGQGTGFSGVENALFAADNTRMFYGDGQKAMAELIQSVKML